MNFCILSETHKGGFASPWVGNKIVKAKVRLRLNIEKGYLDPWRIAMTVKTDIERDMAISSFDEKGGKTGHDPEL